MASPSSSFLFFLLLAASSSLSFAFNITKLLDRHPGFGTLNGYLTQTKLADEINRRETLTVLAVDDVTIGSISGQPIDVIKKILSVHVILDFYDLDKLQHLHKKTALLTTLFQASGLAQGQTGFLNVTVSHTGVVFGSAVAGAGLDSRFIEPVAAQPYNISVLHVSSVIVPPGIQNTNQTQASPPPPSSPPPPAAAPEAPAKSTPPAASPPKIGATAPSPSDDSTPADAPADAPAADGDEPSSPDAAPAGGPATSAAPQTADPVSDGAAQAPGPSGGAAGTRMELRVAAATLLFVGCLLS